VQLNLFSKINAIFSQAVFSFSLCDLFSQAVFSFSLCDFCSEKKISLREAARMKK